MVRQSPVATSILRIKASAGSVPIIPRTIMLLTNAALKMRSMNSDMYHQFSLIGSSFQILRRHRGEQKPFVRWTNAVLQAIGREAGQDGSYRDVNYQIHLIFIPGSAPASGL